MWWLTVAISAPVGLRQEDCHQSEESLSYAVNFIPAWDTEWERPCLKPTAVTTMATSMTSLFQAWPLLVCPRMTPAQGLSSGTLSVTAGAMTDLMGKSLYYCAQIQLHHCHPSSCISLIVPVLRWSQAELVDNNWLHHFFPTLCCVLCRTYTPSPDFSVPSLSLSLLGLDQCIKPFTTAHKPLPILATCLSI